MYGILLVPTKHQTELTNFQIYFFIQKQIYVKVNYRLDDTRFQGC